MSVLIRAALDLFLSHSIQITVGIGNEVRESTVQLSQMVSVKRVVEPLR